MGDTKRNRKKYETPRHPWQSKRIEAEGKLEKEYGTKNKKELWKMEAVLKKAVRQAKKLFLLETDQAEKEKKALMTRLQRMGLLKADNKLEDVLKLDVKDIMERRLQTLVHRKGLSRTMNQSRQFITHEHITVNGKTITSPSHIVAINEEDTITFIPRSSLSNTEHPERKLPEKKEEAAKATEEQSSSEPQNPKASETPEEKTLKETEEAPSPDAEEIAKALEKEAEKAEETP